MDVLRILVFILCVASSLLFDAHPASCKDQHLVTKLPGQPAVGFRHYAGYVTINKKNGRAIFYWFFEASTKADDKPLTLWLNGGPGCSSVGYGATQEIGPFIIDKDGNRLRFNPESWNTETNLLFIESPVGVGFSYSNTTADYKNIGDNFTANDTYAFLHNWFKKFPKYRNRTFYIAGESYAGRYIPELAELIHDMNKDPSLYIDLKGFLVGNPETSDNLDWQGFVDYAWSHAIVSDTTYGIIKGNCNFNKNTTWDNIHCKEAVDEVLSNYKEIDMYSLYTPICIQESKSLGTKYTKQILFKTSSKMMPRILGGYDPCLDSYATSYYNRPDVQKALHVNNGFSLKNWTICNLEIFNGWKDSMPSVLPIYKKLIAEGLRIWVYSGDTDGRVPVLATRYNIDALGLTAVGSWRPWYHQKQVSGWFQEYKGLTFATFKGAGHAVPLFDPSSSLAFFTSFLAGEPPQTVR